jgi:CRP-like cAMP-binding protein
MLKEVWVFKDQTNFVLKKLSELIERPPDLIHKQYLYKEGDLASHVFIVVRGNFLISKKVLQNVASAQLFDPEFHMTTKNQLRHHRLHQKQEMCSYGQQQVVGEEDVLLGNKYTTTAVCTS